MLSGGPSSCDERQNRSRASLDDCACVRETATRAAHQALTLIASATTEVLAERDGRDRRGNGGEGHHKGHEKDLVTDACHAVRIWGRRSYGPSRCGMTL